MYLKRKSRGIMLWEKRCSDPKLGDVSNFQTVTTTMILNKNTMACSPNGNANNFDIVTGVLQEDTLVPYIYNLPRLHILNVNRSNKRKWFHTKKRNADDIPQIITCRLCR